VCTAPVVPGAVRAQSVAEHIAASDREKMDPAAALHQFEAALALEPNNYEALYKASEWAVDAGQLATDRNAMNALYKRGEDYARHAIQVNPTDAEGHFALAKALGRTAQSLGVRDR